MKFFACFQSEYSYTMLQEHIVPIHVLYQRCAQRVFIRVSRHKTFYYIQFCHLVSCLYLFFYEMGTVVVAKFLTYVRDKYVACRPATIAWAHIRLTHYSDVIMSAMASQITSLTIVYSTVYSGTGQRNHQSSASLAFVGNSRVTGESPAWRVNKAEMFPFDDVIMRGIFLP